MHIHIYTYTYIYICIYLDCISEKNVAQERKLRVYNLEVYNSFS